MCRKTTFKRKKICKSDITDATIDECLKSLKDPQFSLEIFSKEIAKLKLVNNALVIEKQNDIIKQKDEKIKHLIDELKSKENVTKYYEYIYMLKEREFVKSGEDIYKIGKTITLKNRMNQYPRSSQIIMVQPCNNCNEDEKNLLTLFRESYKNRTDIGSEYFEGNSCDMINTINKYFSELI